MKVSALAALLLILASGCVKKTLEIRVRDAGHVGVRAPNVWRAAPGLPPDGVDRMAAIFYDGMGAQTTAARQVGQIAVAAPGAPRPLSIVDPSGLLPASKPGSGLVVSGGWLYASYDLTSSQVLPANDRAGDSIPIVVMTPLSNVAEANEVREPRRWPAYVCLPVGGLYTTVGALLLSVSPTDERDRIGLQTGGVASLAIGLPLLIYGIYNAVASPEIVPLDLRSDRNAGIPPAYSTP